MQVGDILDLGTGPGQPALLMAPPDARVQETSFLGMIGMIGAPCSGGLLGPMYGYWVGDFGVRDVSFRGRSYQPCEC